MSRIGRQPVEIPSGVEVTIDGTQVSVMGPKGSLSQAVHPEMGLVMEDETLRVERPSDGRMSALSAQAVVGAPVASSVR